MKNCLKFQAKKNSNFRNKCLFPSWFMINDFFAESFLILLNILEKFSKKINSNF